jgi:hypothetical protein
MELSISHIIVRDRTLWYNPFMPYNSKLKLYEAQKRHRIKIRANLFEYLSTKKCVDCGEADPVVLDFDHRKPQNKFKSISQMMSGHYSWISLMREIKKCEIRCANCHRRKSYIEQKGFGKTKPK